MPGGLCCCHSKAGSVSGAVKILVDCALLVSAMHGVLLLQGDSSVSSVADVNCIKPTCLIMHASGWIMLLQAQLVPD